MATAKEAATATDAEATTTTSSSATTTTTTTTTTTATSTKSWLSSIQTIVYQIVSGLYVVGCCQVLVKACMEAYGIRMYAIKEYGRVIHEFDPYFNYRATEYLHANGAHKFFTWFDYQSWYPLGRPVGTTIYPGMQFSAVAIKQFILPSWSINDICCFVPVWFGVSATLCTAALCYVAVQSTAANNDNNNNNNIQKVSMSILEDIPIASHIVRYLIRPILRAFATILLKITGSSWGIPIFNPKRNPPSMECAVFTACIMAIVPAHILRSVGGGFDNESVATTAMQLTFVLWCTSLWVSKQIHVVAISILAGVAYFYMVTCWGGYIFVINLIGVHAFVLLLLRKYPYSFDHLYKAYTIFYVVGTFLAVRVPVVGWQPIRSLEQLGPLGVFMIFQLLQIIKIMEQKVFPKTNRWIVRIDVLLALGTVALPIAYYLWSIGYFGPLSARVRGLFVKHTKTGNPLVDSVAEHQAASPEAYIQYLGEVYYIAPIGFGIVALLGFTPSSSFLVMYGITAYYFSSRMVRLVLLTAPIASICGGIALGYTWSWMVGVIFNDASKDAMLHRPSLHSLSFLARDEEEDNNTNSKDATMELDDNDIVDVTVAKANKKSKKKKGRKGDDKEKVTTGSIYADQDIPSEDNTTSATKSPMWVGAIRLVVSAMIIKNSIPYAESFHEKAHGMAQGISHPTIIMKGQDRRSGETLLLDDYREAYWWLRDNTPEDARIMAWWDYGYQITGISNRTTIADGNTWNHEHIALLGRALTSSEKEGHRIARHLADYVLLWTGGGGDDLAKSPHLIRIANSVYRGLCSEPTCRSFGMMSNGQPSPQMEQSLLYRLHSHKLVPGVECDPNRFREVYRTKYGKVRIFKVLKVSKESKEWVENNKLCDAPGSWYCPGQYPPALKKILVQKKDFKQLEDFNAKGEDDSDYQRQYFENLNNKNPSTMGEADTSAKKGPARRLSTTEIEMLNEQWEDNEMTSTLFQIVSANRLAELKALLQAYPEVAHLRSQDGRGPMWWAHERGHEKVVAMLKKHGVTETRSDENGVTPLQISKVTNG